MSDFCQITIVGRLCKDTESKKVGEHTLVKGSLAYSTGFGDKKKSCFLDFSAWNRTGEAVARLGKGDPIMVIGQIVQDTWAKDGQKRSAHKLEIEKVVYISAKKDDNGDTAMTRPVRPAAETAFDVSEAPF